jgi:hypothetical protein
MKLASGIVEEGNDEFEEETRVIVGAGVIVGTGVGCTEGGGDDVGAGVGTGVGSM